MNPKVKLGLYAALIIGAVVFGAMFYSTYKSVNKSANATNFPPTEVIPAITNATNAVTTNTNLPTATNSIAETNTATETNTNSGVATNLIASNIVVEPTIQTHGGVTTSREPTEGRGTMITYFAAFLGIAILLGLLIARDISEYVGSRSVEFMFNDEGTAQRDPEYEEAEQVWANGQHLDAIRMMREYLIKNPREQYVALRIAEIYEKDLKNNLAAILEYEEILKNKLPPQRWGWAAIHLCNLYSKLHKTDEAVALLHRIVNEYGETPAAEKARKRLAMFETAGEEGLEAEIPEGFEAPPMPEKTEEQSDPKSNLPPGFRPKK